MRGRVWRDGRSTRFAAGDERTGRVGRRLDRGDRLQPPDALRLRCARCRRRRRPHRHPGRQQPPLRLRGGVGRSAAIELDVSPHADVASAEETYRTAVPARDCAGVPPKGATFSESSFAIDGDVAYIRVRQGKLVFTLSVTNDINTELGLVELANLVVQRAGTAAGE